MGHVRFMKDLTYKDIMDAMVIKDPMEQQMFFLSRFFEIPIDTLNDMSALDVYPMIIEMNEFFGRMEKESGFSMSGYNVPPNPNSPNVMEEIEERYDILDIREEDE